LNKGIEVKGDFFKKLLLQPRSEDKDIARQEFIFNILILGCIVLAAVTVGILVFNSFRRGPEFIGMSPYFVFLGLLGFSFLYLLSRIGKIGYLKFSIYSFISLSLLITFSFSIKWGSLLPKAVLLYALIVVLASILISSKASFTITILISGFLISVSYLQFNNLLITNDDLWLRREAFDIADAIAASVTLGVVALVSWLSNREIEKSLKRARDSESALKEERDLLEQRVEEKTRELRRNQLEKVQQLYRFAEFGRLTSGFLHDLADPLTAVSLGVQRMERFIKTVRKQIQKQEKQVTFSLSDEIREAVQMLSRKAEENDVKILKDGFSEIEALELYGDPVRFNQLVTNLISNAIEAYEGLEEGERKREVLVKLYKRDYEICLNVQDWGKGINEADIEKVFDPFFTTKSPEKGTGIGLFMCKNIVEKNFNGRITIGSREGKGTIFMVELPVETENRRV